MEEQVPRVPPRRERRTVTTLMVPFSVDSALKETIQKAEDDLQKVLGGDRVRVVERGGETLSNLLCRSDPWAADRMCGDDKCWTCQSLVWFGDQKKMAKSQGVKIPEGLILPKSRMCRREGATYSIQCADCLLVGSKVVYQGECSVSSRQRHKQHAQDLSSGLVTSPLVHHTLEVHGGIRLRFVAAIGSLEATPLYRVVRESVNISCLPAGQGNLNRCQEWGCPRIPIIAVQGGGQPPPTQGQLAPNPRPGWTKRVFEVIEEGRTKRVRLCDSRDEALELEPGDMSLGTIVPNAKRRKRSPKEQKEDVQAEQQSWGVGPKWASTGDALGSKLGPKWVSTGGPAGPTPTIKMLPIAEELPGAEDGRNIQLPNTEQQSWGVGPKWASTGDALGSKLGPKWVSTGGPAGPTPTIEILPSVKELREDQMTSLGQQPWGVGPKWASTGDALGSKLGPKWVSTGGPVGPTPLILTNDASTEVKDAKITAVENDGSKESTDDRSKVGPQGEREEGGDVAGPGGIGTGQSAESWHSAMVEDPAPDLVGEGGDGETQDVPKSEAGPAGTPGMRSGKEPKPTILQPPASEGGPCPTPRTVRPGVKKMGAEAVRAQRKGMGAWLARARRDKDARVGPSDTSGPKADGVLSARMGQGPEGGGVEREGEGVFVSKGKSLDGQQMCDVTLDPCPDVLETTGSRGDRSQGMSGDRGSSL